MENKIEKTIKNNQIKSQLLALIPLLILIILAAGEMTTGWMDTSSLNITFYIVIFIAAWIVVFYFLEINKTSKLRAKLRMEDEILSETLNSLDEGVITTDLNGTIQSMNPKAERLTLWKENNAVGMPVEKVFDAHYEDSGKPYTNVVRRVLRNGKPIQYENHTLLRKRNAEQIAISNSGFPIWNRKNKMVGSVLVFRDISENISLSRENTNLTHRLLLATQSTGIGIWEWDVENDKLIWDENMHAIYNIPKTSKQQISDAWNENIHSKDKARVFQEIEDALNSNSEYASEFRIHWQDGSIHYIKTKGVVERNMDGRAVKMIGASWDVTESRRRESDVRRSDAFIRGVMNSLYTQIAVLDQRGVVITTSESWNQASNNNGDKMLENLQTGSNYFSECENAIHHGVGAAADLLSGIRSVFNGELKDFYLEYSIPDDGDKNWYSIHVNRFENDENLVVLEHQNITTRKIAELSKEKLAINLMQKNKNLQQFSYTLSHNLRAPLANIMGCAEILGHYPDYSKEMSEIAIGIQDSAQKMDGVIRDLSEKMYVETEKSSENIDVIFQHLKRIHTEEIKHKTNGPAI